MRVCVRTLAPWRRHRAWQMEATTSWNRHGPRVVDGLTMGTPPVFEPGSKISLCADSHGRLRFTRDASAVSAADVVWMTADTPVDENDKADVASIVTGITGLFPHIQDGALVIMSSQVPVGTTALLEKSFETYSHGRRVRFAYAPENLRLGKAIDVFTRPDRVVVGLRHAQDRETIAELFRPFTDRIVWMSVESAEMTKHALNAFLATSVTFINEVAALCEQVGADASEVERGLKSDARIGPGAYLSPGGAFAEAPLLRDVTFLSDLGRRAAWPHTSLKPFIPAIASTAIGRADA